MPLAGEESGVHFRKQRQFSIIVHAHTINYIVDDDWYSGVTSRSRAQIFHSIVL